MIKINFVVHTYDKSNRGGVLRVVSMMANYFANKYSVEIVSFGKVEEEAYILDNRVQLTSLNLEKHNTVFYDGILKLKWFKDAYHKIYPCISEDSVIWITSSPPISLLFAVLKITNKNIKVIGCDHTSTIYQKNFFAQKIRNKLLSFLDVMVGLNPQDQEYYLKNGIKAVCIPNGIDFQDTHRKANQKKYLIFVGRFSEEKQPFKAIDLFVKSKLYNSNIILKMFGYGDLEQQMINYIKVNNCEKKVLIVKNETDPSIIYKDAFALILTSKIEGFPMVLLEAMSRNIPCLSFKTPYGPLNIIKNNINGFFIEDDVLDFDDKILSLKDIDTENIYKSIESFEISNILKMWLSLFDEICK